MKNSHAVFHFDEVGMCDLLASCGRVEYFHLCSHNPTCHTLKCMLSSPGYLTKIFIGFECFYFMFSINLTKKGRFKCIWTANVQMCSDKLAF